MFYRKGTAENVYQVALKILFLRQFQRFEPNLLWNSSTTHLWCRQYLEYLLSSPCAAVRAKKELIFPFFHSWINKKFHSSHDMTPILVSSVSMNSNYFCSNNVKITYWNSVKESKNWHFLYSVRHVLSSVMMESTIWAIWLVINDDIITWRP